MHVPCAGVARARKCCITLPAVDGLEALTLELTVAPPPQSSAVEGNELILYVLDDEPVLFGAAVLYAYAGAGYYRTASADTDEAGFSRLHVVGIGFEASAYSSTAEGFDGAQLRSLRRRHFPPCEHPSNNPDRPPNPYSRRLALELANIVFPYAEKQLGLSCRPATRALLGSSYSAVLALQVLLHAPDAIDAYILGSPSLPFDPELRLWLEQSPLTSLVPAPAAFIACGALEREEAAAGEVITEDRPGQRCSNKLANVHRRIPDASHELAALLRQRGFNVDGAHEIEGEDHTSLKLPLISRGVGWLLSEHNQRQGQEHAPAAKRAKC